MLDRRQPKGLRLAEMLGNGPLAWEEQRVSWRFGDSRAAGRVIIRELATSRIMATGRRQAAGAYRARFDD
jgi:hypothetical protein